MSQDNLTLNIVVVGAGLIGERHARLISQLDGFDLCAIVDPSENSKSLANELEAKHFESLSSFIESKILCDGAIIATPNETHREFALSCFEKGLPCLIEKPLAANSEDAIAIAKASLKADIPVLVGHHRRHHSVSTKLKEKIETKELGKLVGAQLTWMLRKPDEYFKEGKWRTQKGGGPIWINLIHEIDLLRYFMGEIVEVSAFTSNVVRDHAVEDTGVINMRCENGALVSIIVSDATPSPWHFEGGSGENPNISHTGYGGMRIFGTKGSIEFPSLRSWAHETKDGHWGLPIHANNQTVQEALGSEIALTSQLQNFVNMITNGATPLVSVLDGVQSVRIIEAIHQSAKNGKSVRVATGEIFNNNQKQINQKQREVCT